MTWNVKSPTHCIATFAVKSIDVEVDFEQREAGGAWHVGFDTVSGDFADQANLSLALGIFSGVSQAVSEFAESHQPEVMTFTADDPDIARIDTIYFRREKVNIEAHGYALEGPRRIQSRTEWILRRVKRA